MKVIEPGLVPNERIKRIKCDNCKAVFEFALKEAKLTSDWRDGDFYQIGCPTCHKTHTWAA